MNATMRFLVWGGLPLGSLLGSRTALLIGTLGACLSFLPVFFSPLRRMRTLPTVPEQEAPMQAPVA